MIDVEKLLTTYLKAETGERVVGEIPSSTGTPWILIRQFDADDRTRPTDRLNCHFLQLDCYASVNGPEGQGEAASLAFEVRKALHDMPVTDFTGAVVTSVVVRGPRRITDTGFSPARQRYILEAEIYVHP